MNLKEINALYQETLARAEGESANEGSDRRDPDSWLLAREMPDGTLKPVVVPRAGTEQRDAKIALQAAERAEAALAQIQELLTAASGVTRGAKNMMAAQNVEDNSVSSDMSAEVATTAARSAASAANNAAAASRRAAEFKSDVEAAAGEAATAAQAAQQAAADAQAALARMQEAEQQAVEAADVAASTVSVWSRSSAYANRTYTSLDVLGCSEQSSFTEVLDAMPNDILCVGLFHLTFNGSDPPLFVDTMWGDDREYLERHTYELFVEIHKSGAAYTTAVTWIATSPNGVRSPVSVEDRVVFGRFNTGWALRAYTNNPNFYEA